MSPTVGSTTCTHFFGGLTKRTCLWRPDMHLEQKNSRDGQDTRISISLLPDISQTSSSVQFRNWDKTYVFFLVYFCHLHVEKLRLWFFLVTAQSHLVLRNPLFSARLLLHSRRRFANTRFNLISSIASRSVVVWGEFRLIASRFLPERCAWSMDLDISHQLQSQFAYSLSRKRWSQEICPLSM